MSKRKIVHIEIPATDHEESKQFYTDLFGWETQDFPEMMYVTFDSGSVGGGFSPVGDFPEMGLSTKPGDVHLFIESDDIEADLKRIEAAGGQALSPKTEIPNVGWFAFFTDPTGNQLALYTDSEPTE